MTSSKNYLKGILARKKMSDLTIVREQFNKIWELESIPFILKTEHPSIKKNSIGKTSGKFTYSNYYERYKECIDDNNYQLMMQDESIITMFYSFNDNESISKYNLSFIPSLNCEIDENNCEINNIIGDVENYVRIDLDEKGYEKIVHEKQHLHLGLNFNTKNNERHKIRLPIGEKLYPFDFIYLILKFVYNMSEKYSKYFDSVCKDERCKVININEQLFHIKYNFVYFQG